MKRASPIVLAIIALVLSAAVAWRWLAGEGAAVSRRDTLPRASADMLSSLAPKNGAPTGQPQDPSSRNPFALGRSAAETRLSPPTPQRAAIKTTKMESLPPEQPPPAPQPALPAMRLIAVVLKGGAMIGSIMSGDEMLIVRAGDRILGDRYIVVRVDLEQVVLREQSTGVQSRLALGD